jgi:chemotaxis protein CheD
MNAARDQFRNFWDARFNRHSVILTPGDFYVSDTGDEVITTVLGSCVAACIYDKKLKIGGVNHFMLPADPNLGSKSVKSWMFEYDNKSARYGSVAMELLINEIIKRGGQRKNLEAQIFGGGNITADTAFNVSGRNVVFVEEYLSMERIAVTGRDVGNTWPLKIYCLPDKGQVYIKPIRNADGEKRHIVQQEKQYLGDLQHREVLGGIYYLD